MNRIKIVIVGLNFGSHFLDRSAEVPHRQYLEVVGVCDLDAKKAEAKALAFDVSVYTSLDEVLADPQVEAVGLFSGPAGRAELIRKIIRAGKHVLTTKPFELDANAALTILREARQLGRAVIMNSPSPLLPPDLALVAQWRAQFDLGRPIAARFDVTASYNEKPDGGWSDDPKRCPVAPIFRIGIYLINDAVRLFGEADEVRAVWSRIRTERPTPDNAQLSILFKNGAIANIFASFCIDDGDSYRNQMTLNFERGTVFRNAGANRMIESAKGSDMQLVRSGVQGREVAAAAEIAAYNPHFVYQTDYFYRFIRGESTEESIAPETIAAAIRIIEAMSRAQDSGGTAKVEPAEPA